MYVPLVLESSAACIIDLGLRPCWITCLALWNEVRRFGRSVAWADWIVHCTFGGLQWVTIDYDYFQGLIPFEMHIVEVHSCTTPLQVHTLEMHNVCVQMPSWIQGGKQQISCS
jgi:hypothetical protein